MAQEASVQTERIEMGEPGGRMEVDRGPQGPITRPGVRRRRVMRAGRQTAKRKSSEAKTGDERGGTCGGAGGTFSQHADARLNSCFVQTGVVLEYDGAVVHDLGERLSWAFACIDALGAAVVAQPREGDCSAGLGASDNTVVSAERLKVSASARSGLGMARSW